MTEKFSALTFAVPRFAAEIVEAAPPRYVLPEPFVVHDFESATGWFPTNAGPITIASDGDGGLLFTDTSAAASGTATNHNVGTFTAPSTWGVVALLTDLGDDPDAQVTSGVGVRVGSGGAAGSGGTYNSTASIGDNLGGGVRPQDIGEYWSCGVASAMTGLPGAGAIGLRTEASPAPGGRAIKQKVLLGNAAGRPTIMLTFDDGLVTQATTALAMMQYYGFKGTAYIPWANIGVVGGRMSVAQVQMLRDAGWAICLDGTEDDGLMTDLADPDAVVAKLEEGRDWLDSNGFAAEGGNHIGYPNGIMGVNPTPVQKTGASGSLGSPVLTMASTTGLVAGMRVVGVGIPNSPVTRIDTVDSATQITLTANLTVAMSSGRFKAVDDSGDFHTRKIQDALHAAGFKSGRGTIPGNFYSRYGIGNRGLVLPSNTTTNATVGMIESYVNDAIARGGNAIIYLHGVVGTFNPADGTDSGHASAGLSIGVSVLNTALAYIRSKANSNELDVLTVPEWWARDCETPAVPPGL